MNQPTMMSSFSIERLLVVGVLLFLSATTANAADSLPVTEEGVPLATLHVRGEAQLLVEPDQVSVTIGVNTEADNVKQAMAENSKKMTAIIAQLGYLGVKDKEYKSQGFRVQPVRSSRSKQAGKSGRSTIVAYRVNNHLQLTTQRISDIGEMIEAVSGAGANHIHSIHFGLANPREYRSQAVAQAMKNAKDDATTLAAASGDRILRTLSLRLDHTEASRSRADVGAVKAQASFALREAAPAPPVNVGDITVRASVSATYEIAPK